MCLWCVVFLKCVERAGWGGVLCSFFVLVFRGRMCMFLQVFIRVCASSYFSSTALTGRVPDGTGVGRIQRGEKRRTLSTHYPSRCACLRACFFELVGVLSFPICWFVLPSRPFFSPSPGPVFVSSRERVVRSELGAASTFCFCLGALLCECVPVSLS